MNRKQALVVGLGQFGMAVARALTNRGVEVLAIDTQKDRVRLASSFVTEAACFDGTDEEALMQTAPERREVCVCAIGNDARDASIICTALLRQMGARKIVARANTEVHQRILKLVGAHYVVNPEWEFGERFAGHLVYDEMIGELMLGTDFTITELKVPMVFIGRTLHELALYRQYGVTVVVLHRQASGRVVLPQGDEILEENDILVVVSKPDAVFRMLERL